MDLAREKHLQTVSLLCFQKVCADKLILPLNLKNTRSLRLFTFLLSSEKQHGSGKSLGVCQCIVYSCGYETRKLIFSNHVRQRFLYYLVIG